MEKQVNWRALSGLGSHRPDGGGGKDIRRGEERRFVSSWSVGHGALFTPPVMTKGRGEMVEAGGLNT